MKNDESKQRIANKIKEDEYLSAIEKQLSVATYGTAINDNKEIEIENQKFKETISKILNSTEIEMNGKDVISALSAYMSSNGVNPENNIQFKNLKNAIENEDGNIGGSLLSYAYMSYNGQVQYYKDLKLVSTLIPQLEEVLETITDNILTGDDFSNLTSLNIPGDETDMFKKIDERYDFVNELRICIRETCRYGYHYVSVIPYSKAFTKLKQSYATRNGIRVNTKDKTVKKDVEKMMSESFTEDYYEDSIDDKTKESISAMTSEFLENIEFAEGVENLFDLSKNDSEINDNSLECLAEAINKKLNKNDFNALFNKSKKEASKVVDGFITKKKPEIEQYKNLQEETVSGCYIKHYDITKVIPIKVDDTALGYYYIEDIGDLQTIRNIDNNPMTVLNRSIARMDQRDPRQASSDTYFSSLADILMKSIIKDKKFLKDNIKLKEEIYSILKYGDLLNKKIRITYIPAEDMVEFGDGLSVLAKSLFYAKLYLTLLLTHIGLKVNRGYDKRIVTVATGASKDVSSDVVRAIRDIKTDQRSILFNGNVNSILNSAGGAKDIFIPKSKSGEKPIEFDVLSGQDIPIKDEIMEFLEERMVDGTGYPLALLQASADVDFAKSLTLLNSKVMRRTLSRQYMHRKDLNIFYNLVRRSELISSSDYSEYTPVNIEFKKPVSLGLATMIDQLSNAKSLVDDLSSMYSDGSNSDEDTLIINTMSKKMMREFVPAVPWDKLDKLYAEAQVEVSEKLARNKAKEDGEEESPENM